MKQTLLLRGTTTASLLLLGLLLLASGTALRAQTTPSPTTGHRFTFATTATKVNMTLKMKEGATNTPWIDLNKDGAYNLGEEIEVPTIKLPAAGSYTVYAQELQELVVKSGNQLTSLNVSGCTALSHLICNYIQLTSLDVSGCTALSTLYCFSNQLTSLDVSGCTALTELHCYSNQLTALDVSGCTALTTLYCHSNQLTSLDVSGYTHLSWLFCYDNQITALNVSGCTTLDRLNCSSNQLTALNVSGCTNLTDLECGDNPLTSLDASGCTSLPELYAISNTHALTSLNVSGCTALTELHCNYNQLTVLDVSGCTALTDLHCKYNQITALDVSKNTALNRLYCSSNQLTSLDVSKNTALSRLECHNNFIEDAAMTELINGLADRTSETTGTLLVYSKEIAHEGNLVSKANVAKAQAKNWDVMAYGASGSEPYEGADFFLVTFFAGTGGTLSATVDGVELNNGDNVEQGKAVTFTATPNPNFKVKSWTIDGTTTETTEVKKELTINKATNVEVVFQDHTGIAEVKGDALTLFPNPADEELNVAGLAVGAEVRLMALDGTLLGTAQADEQGSACIDVTHLPEGEYLLVTPAATRKVVVRR